VNEEEEKGWVQMRILNIEIENFKGISDLKIKFGDSTEILGANASGKTTVFDALTWLLFDRDSLGNNKFEIRTLDAEGNKIHNTVISVTGVFDIDGKEVTIKKSQKENWVKKRGSDVAELQGNKNEYEINGFPKSQKDYQSFISEIVDDDLFKMLTNPMFFPNMKWQEQRRILMRLLPEISDVEIAKKCGCEEIIPDLEMADVDSVKAKYTKAIKEYRKQQAELPVRIDELFKQKQGIDEAELKALEKRIEEAKSDKAKLCSELSSMYEKKSNMQSKILELKFELTEIEKEASADNLKKRVELTKQIESLTLKNSSLQSEIMASEEQIRMAESAIKWNTEQGKRINEEYKKAKAQVFSEDEQTCPLCGQKLPMEKIAEHKATFEKNKKDSLEAMVSNANKLKQGNKNQSDKIQKAKSDIERNKAEISVNNKKISKWNVALEEIPVGTDMSQNHEYKQKQEEITALEKSVENLSETKELELRIETLEQIIAGAESALNEIQNIKANNGRLIVRINELREEQKDVARACADAERMLYMLETFVREKMSEISGIINAKFDGLEWKLFELQINGGLKETCELTVNGVPYGSLNSGHRIVAGLQIIKTLQKVFDVSVPIFIDNAESVNDFNLPEMDCQVVKLIVTDDKKLVIREVEK